MMQREELLHALRGRVRTGVPILAAVQSPLDTTAWDFTIACGIPHGVDLAASLLPIGNANQQLLAQSRQSPTGADGPPRVAGIYAADPLLQWKPHLAELRALGYCGVVNSPSICAVDGHYRQMLEDHHFGYGREVEFIATASDAGWFTAAHVGGVRDAEQMAAAGADVLLVPVELERCSPSECAAKLDAIAEAARAVSPDLLLLAHGADRIATARLAELLQQAHSAAGYYCGAAFLREARQEGLLPRLAALGRS